MAAPRIRWFRIAAIALPVAIVGAILINYGWLVLRRETASMPPMKTTPTEATPFLAAPIDRPAVVAAKDSKLADDEDVIGIVVNGRPRAYRVKAFAGMFSHVVNDLMDTVPVTVTYCDRTNCVQAFTGPQRGETLDIWTGGYDQQLILKFEKTFFWQHTGKVIDSEEVMFPAFPYERRPWKEWRSIHPTTDVYEGR
jgi:hypothetical protein